MEIGEKLACNVVIHTEKLNGKIVYVADCEELGVSDFGYTPEEALGNLRKALKLLISAEPEKAEALKIGKHVMVTRMFL